MRNALNWQKRKRAEMAAETLRNRPRIRRPDPLGPHVDAYLEALRNRREPHLPGTLTAQQITTIRWRALRALRILDSPATGGPPSH